MGSQKKEAILQAKWAVNFVKKAKWAKIEFLDCMALATSPPMGQCFQTGTVSPAIF